MFYFATKEPHPNKKVLSLQRVAAKDMAGEGFTPELVHYEVELQLELLSPLGKIYRLGLPSPFLWLNQKQQIDIEKQIEKLVFSSTKKAKLNNLSLNCLILNAVGRIPHTPLAHNQKRKILEHSNKEIIRSIYTHPGERLEAPVYKWYELFMPQRIEGPALIESKDH